MSPVTQLGCPLSPPGLGGVPRAAFWGVRGSVLAFVSLCPFVPLYSRVPGVPQDPLVPGLSPCP